MGKISLYVGKEYLLYFFSCLISTIIIFSTFVALGEAELVNEVNGWSLFINKLFSSVPGMFETIIPITVLLATVLTLINLSRSSEIVAMMAAGISVRQVVRPILFIGVLISLFFYFNQSYLARWWGVENQITLVAKKEIRNQWMFFRGKLFYFQNLNKKEKKISQGKIIQFDNKFRVASVQQIKGLSLADDNWVTRKNETYTFTNKGIQLNRLRWEPVNKDNFPKVFKPDLLNPKFSPLEAIFENLIIRKQSGISYQELLFAVYQKVASILTIFIMILLALPFSLYYGRDSNVRTGIVISIVLGFIYWLLEQIMMSFFVAGVFSAELSAFGTNIFFLALALFFTYRRLQ